MPMLTSPLSEMERSPCRRAPRSLSDNSRRRVVAGAEERETGSHKGCPYRSRGGLYEGPGDGARSPCRGNPLWLPSPFTVTNASIAATQAWAVMPIRMRGVS